MAGIYLLSSCSPRYTIHRVAGSAQAADDCEYCVIDTGIVFSYDFWSEGGLPYVSVRNETDNPILLNLSLVAPGPSAGLHGPITSRLVSLRCKRFRWHSGPHKFGEPK